ncbi:MAG: AAA family ATPase [archaeon]|nr:AAA family ATPase [archaeon]
MLERKVYSQLLDWKNREHKCLLLYGQRQIGKTFIVERFAEKEYEHFVEFNLARDAEARSVFVGDQGVDRILSRISVLYPETVFEPGKTLIFLDEIQDCDVAYASLKSFNEDGRFDVIASGSLMGVKNPRLKGQVENTNTLVPMGSVENLQMFGLDFEEYLWARKVSKQIIEEVKHCIREKVPLDAVILAKMNEYFREFMIVGGMPRVVSAFVNTGKFSSVKSELSDLRLECLRDINRYNKGVDIVKTTDCFESIPEHLAQSNKKFIYSRIDDGQSRQSADKYMGNLLWIKAAGYGNFCNNINAPVLPMIVNKDSFKVYLSDTGMLVNMYGDNCIKAIYSGELRYNLGAIAENAVAEALMKSGYKPRYFSENKGDKRMELDFVIENGDGIVVIEVKSGKDRTAPSIGKAARFYDIPTRIILSEGNISTSPEGIISMPLFAACFLREMEPVWDGPEL